MSSSSNNNNNNNNAGAAKPSQFTIKYKAYGAPAASSPKVKKRPSEHIREALDPPLPHRHGAIRSRPFIVEKHNIAEQRHHFVSSVPNDEPLFQPFPPEVLFNGYEPFQKYTTVLQLRNNDKVVRRVQLISRDPLLTVHLQSPPIGDQTVFSEIGSSKVACGMEVGYVITFYPEADRDYRSELLAITDREKFIIPVRGVGLKAMLDIPDEIAFPPTPAKCSYKKNVTMHNVAKKKAVFSLKTKGPFGVTPLRHELDPGDFFQCSVYFHPPKVCLWEGELEVTLEDSGDLLCSRLVGDGTELNVGLSTGVVTAATTYIRRTSHVTFQIFNNSTSVAYFLWPKFATEQDLYEYAEQFGVLTPRYLRAEDDSSLSSNIDKAFSIVPVKGEVWPGTLVEITLSFCPLKPLTYVSTTCCIISGKSDPLPLQLQGLGVGPLARFSPAELDLGELCLFSIYKFRVTLDNLGELDAHFRLMETLPSSMASFSFQPDKGTVDVGDCQVFTVTICGNLMGNFSEKFLWEVTDSIDTLSLTFKGTVVMPAFSIEPTELDFGIISYGLHSESYLRVQNKSPVSLPFLLRVEGCPPEFTTDPSSFTLQTGGLKKVAVELVPWEVREYCTTVSLDIPKVGSNFASIPVKATCMVPIVNISTDALSFGTCFLRYEYTQTVSLMNVSQVPARYEIQHQEPETQKLAVLKLKAESGIVPAGSTVDLEFILLTLAVGEISLSSIVSVSGKEFTHYPVKITAVSVGPIVSVERPILKKGQPADTAAWVPSLEFGKVQVLKDHHLSLILRNVCCIPAPLKITIGKKESVFHLNLSELILQPDTSVELKVRAFIDEVSKFSDKIIIQCEGSSDILIPLSATGVGSTVLSKELEEAFIHLGDQFTLRTFTYTFTLENHGRKPQTLLWENETTKKRKALNKSLATEAEKQKPGNKKAAVVIQEVVPVFNIDPVKATLTEHSSLSITITGYSTEPGYVREDFSCKMSSAKDTQYIKLSVDADLAALTLVFSATTLSFVQNNGWGQDGPHELVKSLTCENVSRLPLSFSLVIKSPFFLNQADWTLPPSGTGTVIVSLERQDIKEKRSVAFHGKLDILYTGTLEKNHIGLIARINYPNISLSTDRLPFGCLLENTCTRLHLELKNTSSLEVWYTWVLDVLQIRASEDALDKTEGILIAANQIFDVLPLRGYLLPEEQETVEFSYFAHPGYECRIVAVCEVSGGPQYSVLLEAESGNVAYSFSQTSLDFNVQAFNKAGTRDFHLLNSGRVPFTYDVTCAKGKALKEVSPLNGQLQPSVKQKFTAQVYAGVPEAFHDTFTVQVGYFLPLEISAFGTGAFPHLSLDAIRIRTHKSLDLAAKAFANVYAGLQSGNALYTPRSMDTQNASPENNEPEHSETENLDVPSVEQVDAEIDRLHFLEHLAQDISDYQKLILNKYVCDFENVILGETRIKTVKFTNDGPLPVSFKVQIGGAKGKGFSMDTDRFVTLPPDAGKSSSHELVFKLKTDHPKFPAGLLSCTVPINVKEGPQSSLMLRAYVTKPLMKLSSEFLDFSAVQLGQCKMMYVRLTNVGDVSCNWTAVKPTPESNENYDSSAFSCNPETGSIPPHKHCDVEARFVPNHKKKSYYGIFDLKLEHNSEQIRFTCKGYSFVPMFAIEPSVMELGPLLPNAPEAAQMKFTIRNTADEPIELYSLALDPQYVKEEELLRAADGYDEQGVLLLSRRDAGTPFWDLKGPAETTPVEAQPPDPSVPAASQSSKLLIMILGPPVIGKTTQAKNLSLKFNCPIVDMEAVVVEATTMESASQPADATGIEGFDELETAVLAVLKAKLESGDCRYGAIFDHLDTSYASTLSLIKCILYAAGLQAYDPTAPPDDGKKKPAADKKKPPQEEPPGPLVVPQTFWRGDATVYVLELLAEKQELAVRYTQIPEVDHCKKTMFLDKDAAPQTAEVPVDGSAVADSEPNMTLGSPPNYLKHYPYLSVFPTEEEQETYYSSLSNTRSLVGYAEGGGSSPENKAVYVPIGGLRGPEAILEEELKHVPRRENVEAISEPKILQVVKKPHARNSYVADTSGFKFAIFSVTPDAVPPAAKGGDKKGKPGEVVNPFETIPEGCSKLTRWVIGAHGSVEILLCFWSTNVGNFEQKFVFEALNGQHQARLVCKGVCAEPQITCQYRYVRIPNTKLSPAAKLQKTLFMTEKTLDFGPLPAGRTADGFPNLPDSEHCKRLDIINSGLFDLHADFEAGQAEDGGKKPAAKPAAGKSLFLVNPAAMDLKIGEKLPLSIYCYPPQGQLGSLQGSLVCKIVNNPQPVEFKVTCLSDTPRVELDLNAITFDRLLVGHEDKKSFQIRNVSALVVHWKIVMETGAEEFIFSETSGSLIALATATVNVILKAVQEKMFNLKLKLQVFETSDAPKFAQELPLTITAEAYKIDIDIKYPDPPEVLPPNGGINFGTIKVAQDSLKSLNLENKGKYRVDFKISCKTSLAQNIFTISPSEGPLEPKKQQKIDVHFNKEKKLQKEVTLNQTGSLELQFIEPLTNKVEQTVRVIVNLKAVHSKFELLPAQGLHFGSQICGSTPAPRVLRLLNTGHFEFDFKLLPTATATATEAAAASAPDKGKKPDPKKAAGGDALELTNYRLVPSSGVVAPGNQMEISVFFKTETPSSTTETFKIDITDTDAFLHSGGIVYYLSGEACIPGINREPRAIFYEYQVVEDMALLGPIPTFGIYSKKDNVFSFGPVIINYEKAAMTAAGTQPPVERSKKEASLTARLRIENPLRVPCSLQLSIRKAGEVKPKAAKGGPAEEPLCMELSPLNADIPPLEYRIVTCCFKPLALQKYAAVFEVTVKDQPTPQFQCEFQGEGTLPRINVKSPSLISSLGFPLLQFPRLLVGKTQTLQVIFENNGVVPAIGKVQTSGDENSDWFQINRTVENSLLPLTFGKKLAMPVGSSQTAMVTFAPRAGQQYSQDLQLVVEQNPFDIATVTIAGEGYLENIVCVGLPRNSDDTIWFEDSGIATTTSISFSLKNMSTDKHWRFGWIDVPFLKFTPALGHLHAASSKQIVVSFTPTEVVQYLDSSVYLQACAINYTSEGEPAVWDDTMIPPPDPAAADPKAKAPPPKPKGKPDPKAGPEITIESNMLPGEPPLEVVQGTAKLISLKLHAVGDNTKYECSLQSVQFKSTMMFQARSIPFTLKNLSKASMPFTWRLETQDGQVDSKSMYILEPPSGALSPEETVNMLLKFCPTEVQDCTRILVANIPYLDPSMQPLRIPVNGQVTRPWCHFELARSDYAARRDAHFPGPNGELGPLDPTIQIIEYDSLGSNLKNAKYFTAVNPTNIPYKFVWEEKKSQSLRWTPYDVEPITDDDVFPRPFKCIARTGEIRGGKRYEMGFEYTPNKLEQYESFWVFRIPERKIEVNFLMVGNVKTPVLSLDRSYVDFGKVFVGAKARATIHLKNPEPGAFAFSFDKLSFWPSQPGQVAVLKFNPWTGILAGNSQVPVDLLFSPVVEGEHSFDILCNFKMASPLALSVKADAYIFHEKLYLEGGADGRPVTLVPQEPLGINYGRFIVNSKLYKKFILTNSGKEAFHFMWDCGDNKQLVRAEPTAGVLATDEQLTCDLVFNPTAPNMFENLPVVCQILRGNRYLIHLNGTCYRPKIRFSFTEFNFGPCFLYQQGTEPLSTKLTFTNDDIAEVITVELMYESTSYLEVDPVSLSLKPGHSHTIQVVFKPDAFVAYKEQVQFQICGLDTVVVVFRGEGVPVQLELVDSRQRHASFGVVRLGKTSKHLVQVVNKSKIAAPISFGPSSDVFQKLGIHLSPEDGICLPSRGSLGSTTTIEMLYKPKTRMTHWTEGFVVEVAGTKCRIMVVSGICLAVEVKLNTDVLPFDIVTLGSKVRKKIQLDNVGDLATTFRWDLKKCKSDFTIFPLEGFLAPRQGAKLDVTFHPSRPNPDIRIEGIPCYLEGATEPLSLTVLGGCVEQGAPAETLKFGAPVRQSETKTVEVKNPTTQDWLLHPVISGLFWAGDVTLAIPANATVGYTITYKPMTMSSEHKGVVSFPLPDGTMITYQLLGEAQAPLPDGEIQQDGKARVTIPLSLQVSNWLKTTQQFVTEAKTNEADPSTTLRAPKYFEAPGMSTKECVVYFYAEKPGSTSGSVTFKNEKTGEYSFFNILVNTSKADIVESIKLECFVRQSTSHRIHLKNEMDKPLVFTGSCPEKALSAVSIVPPELEVPVNSAAPVDVIFKPLVADNSTRILTFDNELVGAYEYELLLSGVAAPPEGAPLVFSASLGETLTRPFKFKHVLPDKATYNCQLPQTAIDCGFSVDATVLQGVTAGPEGQELQVQITLEPFKVFGEVESLLRLQSPEGCDYCCKLLASCGLPKPQGPIFIKGGSGQINFKNVYNDTVQFNYATDNPSFAVSKGEKMPPKKQSKLVVNYKAVDDASPKTGRLTVSCVETSHVWLFYLQAI